MLWTSPFLFCQLIFFRITPGKENFLGLWGENALFPAGLFLGFRQGGLRNREDGTHGSLQALKWGLWGGHGRDNITSMLWGLQ